MYLGMKLDLVASRKIIERKKVFQVAEEINLLYKDHLAAKMIITHGDEAQALLFPTCSGQLFDLIEEICQKMEPVAVRFGFGAGNLTTSLRPEAIGMDGPVWHRAEEALRLAKKRKGPLCFPSLALSCLP
ncbi:MAG TPA: SatD family protein [Bacillota bacterium]|nr:SatD family protein [Bacillota bacterium]